MKGLTHFMSGAAVASFFLPAVKMAGAERCVSPFILFFPPEKIVKRFQFGG